MKDMIRNYVLLYGCHICLITFSKFKLFRELISHRSLQMINFIILYLLFDLTLSHFVFDFSLILKLSRTKIMYS